MDHEVTVGQVWERANNGTPFPCESPRVVILDFDDAAVWVQQLGGGKFSISRRALPLIFRYVSE